MYKFNCLALRIKVTPAIFQQIIDTMLSGLNFVVAYLDNILLKSENPEEHKKCFWGFQKNLELWIQAERRKKQIFYEYNQIFGTIVKNGRRPDSGQASAIIAMTAENVSSLQSLLGLVNYYNVFVPNMHCLWALLHK